MDCDKNVLIIGGTRGLGKSLLEFIPIAVGVGSAQLDITNPQIVKKFFEKQTYDIIINCACVNYNGFVDKQTDEQIDQQIAVNAKGLVNIFRYCLPYMRKNNYGRIVTMSSVLTRKKQKGTSIYSATKGFVENLTQAVALENAKWNITINAIRSGYTTEGIIKDVPEELLGKIIEATPQKKLGSPQLLYKIINSLIDNDFMTGSIVDWNGGYLL